MLLSNKVAIITGGATGIGKGIALKFVEEGCNIVIADIMEEESKNTVRELLEKGSDSIFLPCNVSNSAQVQGVVDKVIKKFGKIDILVNNAGIGPPAKSILDISEEEWDKVLSTNLKGVFLYCKAVAPHMMKEKYGKIINVSSLAAIAPANTYVHYCASKAGILGFTYDLALELALFNINVNAICPGPTVTSMWASRMPSNEDEKKDYINKIAKLDGIPLQRVGTPEDIAGVALFLASELSAYMTADRLFVAGGMPLRITHWIE
jgi:3-oxoacyl-[acyl-carrier protein] reductase